MSLFVAALLFLQGQTVDQLIEKLASEDIDERAAATQQLLECGIRHMETLKTALVHPDFEVRNRVKQIVDFLAPQYALSKFGKAFGDAKSIRIKWSGEGREVTWGKIEAIRSSGTLALRDKNRVALQTRVFTAKEGWSEYALVSDGTRMTARFLQESAVRWEDTVDTPKGLQEDLSSTLLWRGLSGALLKLGFLRLPVKFARSENLWACPSLGAFAGTRIQMGEENGLKTFSVGLTPALNGLETKLWSFGVGLWMDPESDLPRKRTITWSRPLDDKVHVEGGRFTETYEEIVLNQNIPEEEFRRSEGKR